MFLFVCYCNKYGFSSTKDYSILPAVYRYSRVVFCNESLRNKKFIPKEGPREKGLFFNYFFKNLKLIKIMQVTIIGNGHLGTALNTGLLKNSFSPFILNRDGFDILTDGYSRDDLADEYAKKIRDSKILFLVVRPENKVCVLEGIRPFVKKHHILVSFVSGLSSEKIHFKTDVSYRNIFVCTGNTNISHKKGLIYFSTYNKKKEPFIYKILKNLCEDEEKINKVPEGDMLKYVVSAGSGNAYDTKRIIKFYADYGANIIFKDYLKTLNTYNPLVNEYLRAKRDALEKVFGFEVSNNTYLEGFFSTLKTLKEKCNTIDDAHQHIFNIVTEGGCTAQGLKELSDFRTETLFNVFLKTYEKAISFSN